MEVISVGPWGFEEGTPFSHPINNGRIRKLVILHEGGLKSLTVKQETDTPYSKKNHQPSSVIIPQIQPANILKTSYFSRGIGAYRKNRGDGCTLQVVSRSAADGFNHEHYVIVSKRKQNSNGIHQDITKEVCVDCIYEIVAYVSLMGGNGQEFQMNAALELEKMDGSIYYILAGSVLVKNMKWERIQCCFQLSEIHKRVTFIIDNPPPHIDLCIGPVSILPLTRRFVVSLDQDEYFTGITGHYRRIQNEMTEVISSLTFLTNRKEYGPYGSKKGTFFSFKTSNGEIIGFHGTSGNYLSSIGCHVKPSKHVVNMKKEAYFNCD